MKTRITEAQAEKIVDRRVWSILQHDLTYNNPIDYEARSEREDEVEAKVWSLIEERYEIL